MPDLSKAVDLQDLAARVEKLEQKNIGEAAPHIARSEKLAAVLPEVRATLELISNSPDVDAHTRGPLSRKALELLKDL